MAACLCYVRSIQSNLLLLPQYQSRGRTRKLRAPCKGPLSLPVVDRPQINHLLEWQSLSLPHMLLRVLDVLPPLTATQHGSGPQLSSRRAERDPSLPHPDAYIAGPGNTHARAQRSM
jgi:hypothetical protein